MLLLCIYLLRLFFSVAAKRFAVKSPDRLRNDLNCVGLGIVKQQGGPKK